RPLSSTLSSQLFEESSDGVMIQPPAGSGDDAGAPADPNVPSWAETAGAAASARVASAVRNPMECRLMRTSVRNHYGVASPQIHRRAAADCALVVERDRLDAAVGASQDPDVLGVGKILHPAGDC